MAFQQGNQAIPNGASTITVTFPVAFTAPPDIIIPVIENTSADAPKYLFFGNVVAKDLFGFTVSFTGTNVITTGNYVLTWVAGSAAAILQVLQAMGVKISQLTALAADLKDTDYLPFVHTDPYPITKRLHWGVLRAFFPNLQQDPPANPNSPGEAGMLAIDDTWIYTHDGINWGRSQRYTAGWDATTGSVPEQSGQIALVQGQNYIDITYPTPFPANPRVEFSFCNFGGATDKQILSGLQVTQTTTGCRIWINTGPDSPDYKLNWTAKL